MPDRRFRGVAAMVSLLASLSLVVTPVFAASPQERRSDPPQPAKSSVVVVANGLNNPRGIDIAANGRIYVAEAGTGEPGSGRITVIDGRKVSTFIGNLPSGISEAEGDVTGPTNVALRSTGDAVATIGAGDQNADSRFNTLLRLRSDRTLADIQAYVNKHPDKTDLDQPANPTDSNPYGLARLNGGFSLVTDAANNTLLMVGPGHFLRTVAKFPNEVISTAGIPNFPGPAALPAEAVPTSVAIGPDGYWYVGELKGFPFTPGTSRIWRVAPWAHNAQCDASHATWSCSLWMDGFTSITGLAFGRDRSLYVVEIAKNGVPTIGPNTGALYRVRHGVKTELVPGQLSAPGDVAVARNGTVYVTNWSVASGIGQVLAIRP